MEKHAFAKCEWCDDFATPEHVKCCTKQKTECPECHEQVPTRALAEHTAKWHTHKAELVATIECNVCHERFKSRVQLGRHVAKTHPKQETVYKCPTCETFLISEENLTQHMTTVHPEGGKKRVCPFCNHKVANLSTHIKWNHPEETIATRVCKEVLAETTIPEEHRRVLPVHAAWGYEHIVDRLVPQLAQNDVGRTEWWRDGAAPEAERVTKMTCDNFVLRVHIPDEEIKDGDCLTTRAYHAVIESWLAQANIKARVKCTAWASKAKYVNYKISVCDEPLDNIFTLLGNTALLMKWNFQFLDIDIKCDYSTTLDPEQVRHHVEANYKVGNATYQESRTKYYEDSADRLWSVDNDTTSGLNTVTYLVPFKGGFARAKIYNKFVCSLLSPGSREMVGDNVSTWQYNPGTELNRAIADSRTRNRGLSRIEFTVFRSVPTRAECDQFTAELERMFLPGCVTQPIAIQWQMLESQLRNTLVVYNCFTGQYNLVRWGCHLHKKYNGVKAKLSCINPTSFMQIVSMCSLTNVPIDIVMVTCTVSNERETVDIPMDFTRLIRERDTELEGGITKISNYKYGVFSLNRIGENRETLFLNNNALYSRVEVSDGMAVSLLPALVNCQPQIHTRYFSKNSNFDSARLEFAGYNTDLYDAILAGRPTDGLRVTKYIAEVEAEPTTLYSPEPLISTGAKNLTTLKVDETYSVTRFWCKRVYGKEKVVLQLADHDGCYYGTGYHADLELEIRNKQEWRFTITGVEYDRQRNRIAACRSIGVN